MTRLEELNELKNLYLFWDVMSDEERVEFKKKEENFLRKYTCAGQAQEFKNKLIDFFNILFEELFPEFIKKWFIK